MMGLRGPPPKPKALHVAQGTRAKPGEVERKAGGIDYEPLLKLPDPPGYLGPDGREMWTQLGEQLMKAGVLQVPDMWMFRLLCGLWDRNQRAMRGEGMLEVLASDNSTLQRLLSEFGAPPSSRRRIAPSGNAKDQNPFNKFKPQAVA